MRSVINIDIEQATKQIYNIMKVELEKVNDDLWNETRSLRTKILQSKSDFEIKAKS